MTSVMETLVKFATETKYGDLPQKVVHESKLILLDSIGCALGGLSIDKGKIAVELARRLHGAREATIIGTGGKVSCYGAAFANGELIHAMNFECGNHPAGHVIPFVLAAPLALAEHNHASGKELIRAIAVAIEISVRFGKAFPGGRADQNGENITPPIRGYSWNIFGGTAASGLILGLDPAQMAHALGIAGVIAPVSARQKFQTTLPVAMAKHLMAGWVCGAEIIAAFLADMGYIGDTTVLDGDYGFWRFSGYTQWKPSAITEQIGESWHCATGTNYKLYPCCGVPMTPLECFINIINEHNIQPQDIEKVIVYLSPYHCFQPLWPNREIRTQMDAQYSVPYNFSVAAHRVKAGPEWQDLATTMHNPSILELMKRITLSPHPEFAKVHKEDPTASIGKVEVVAKGKIFSREQRYCKGSPSPEEFRLKDEEIVEKFRHQASTILPANKVTKTVGNILGLEGKKDISEVMKNVAQK